MDTETTKQDNLSDEELIKQIAALGQNPDELMVGLFFAVTKAEPDKLRFTYVPDNIPAVLHTLEIVHTTLRMRYEGQKAAQQPAQTAEKVPDNAENEGRYIVVPEGEDWKKLLNDKEAVIHDDDTDLVE